MLSYQEAELVSYSYSIFSSSGIAAYMLYFVVTDFRYPSRLNKLEKILNIFSS